MNKRNKNVTENASRKLWNVKLECSRGCRSRQTCSMHRTVNVSTTSISISNKCKRMRKKKDTNWSSSFMKFKKENSEVKGSRIANSEIIETNMKKK